MKNKDINSVAYNRGYITITARYSLGEENAHLHTQVMHILKKYTQKRKYITECNDEVVHHDPSTFTNMYKLILNGQFTPKSKYVDCCLTRSAVGESQIFREMSAFSQINWL